MCQVNQEEYFNRLIMQDETWVHHYDPENKAQSKLWKHYDLPPPKKARIQPLVSKVMLTVFWDQHGVVMMAFLAEGTTITRMYYASLLQKLREVIKTERCGMLTKGIHLLQDNAPVHNAHVAQMKAWSCGYEILPHSPYPPDLTQSDFHLFPIMKLFLKSKFFSDDEMLISEVVMASDTICRLLQVDLVPCRWRTSRGHHLHCRPVDAVTHSICRTASP